MKAIKIDGVINVHNGIPHNFKRPDGSVSLAYQKMAPEVHLKDGWKDFVLPDFDKTTHKLGEKIDMGTHFTQEVVEMTQEEKEAVQEQIQNAVQEEIKTERNNLLRKGVLVVSDSGTYWFDEMALMKFISLMTLMLNAGMPTMRWKNKDGGWVDEIPMEECKAISIQAAIKIQQIYLEH